jgi:hypothetical protein
MKYLKSVLMLVTRIFLVSGFVVSSPLFANPPSNSGPRVFRTEILAFAVIEANGMAAFVGADISALCEGEDWFGFWEYMIIDSPADIDLAMLLAKGDDVPTYVYPEAAIVWEDGWIDLAYLCEYDQLYGEIASGTSNVIYTDNDANAADNLHERVNSFGVSATGVLFTPSDDPVSFSGGRRCLWSFDQDPDKTWVKCRDRLNLGE